VHPEAYPVVRRILASVGTELPALIGDSTTLRALRPTDFIDDTFGLPTVTDILAELEKPGRDPRPAFKTATFADGVEKLSDLTVGMVLEGVVTNVAAFGAFVDVGVHQDGLVHVSAMSNRFVSDPREIVKPGDIVRVKVREVDINRKRISLTLRLDDDPAAERRGGGRGRDGIDQGGADQAGRGGRRGPGGLSGAGGRGGQRVGDGQDRPGSADRRGPGDRPGSGRPGADKPAARRPGTDKPAAGRPGADKPAAAGRPGADNQAAGRPGADKQGGGRDRPGADKQGGGRDRPGADKQGGGRDRQGGGRSGGDRQGGGGLGGGAMADALRRAGFDTKPK
jgi:uncharacterized protein